MKNNGNTFHACLILRVWKDCWSCVVRQPAIRRSTKSRCAKYVSDIMQYATKWEHDEYPEKFGVLNLWAKPFAWTGFEFAHLTQFKGYAWVWTSISVDGSFREMLQHLHTLHDIRAIRIQVTNFLSLNHLLNHDIWWFKISPNPSWFPPARQSRALLLACWTLECPHSFCTNAIEWV